MEIQPPQSPKSMAVEWRVPNVLDLTLDLGGEVHDLGRYLKVHVV